MGNNRVGNSGPPSWVLAGSVLLVALTVGHVEAATNLLTNGDFETAPNPANNVGKTGNVTGQGYYTQGVASTSATYPLNGWTFGRTTNAGSVNPSTGPRFTWFNSAGTAGTYANWVPAPEHGSYAVDLNTDAKGTTTQIYVQQTVTGLLKGGFYKLTFWYAGETTYIAGTAEGMQVKVSGTAVTSTTTTAFTAGPETAGKWHQGTLTFKATSAGSATLQFLDNNASSSQPTENTVMDNANLTQVTPEPSTLGFGAVLIGGLTWRELRRRKNVSA